MKFAIFGTGPVGATIGTKLVQLGHEVKMGSRDPKSEKAAAWVKEAGGKASHGTLTDAAGFCEIAINCQLGAGSVEGLKSAGETNLAGKLIIDISNPLDFSRGMPPSLFTPPGDSLAEMIQRTFPKSHVVKALNHVSAPVMVNPGMLKGEHDAFICGDDAGAKAKTTELLKIFGWRNVVDFGPISAARGLEAYVQFWVGVMVATGTPMFNIKVVR